MTYADHIRAAYIAANDQDRAQGRAWYPEAYRIVASIAERSGLDLGPVAAMLAALSPRNPWRWNVQDCAAFALAVRDGGAIPSATTFGANRRTAWAFGMGSNRKGRHSATFKRGTFAFVIALMGGAA